MSEQLSQPVRPATTDTKPEGPDDREPTPERQTELRAAYEANVAAGEAPYEGVWIRTLDELRWIMEERRWSGASDVPPGYERANLRGAVFTLANLSGAQLYGANLSDADLRTVLNDAQLHAANLTHADLTGAGLSAADLGEANLQSAYLTIANLSGAQLYGANLSDVDLRACFAAKSRDGMAYTVRHDATLSKRSLRCRVGPAPTAPPTAISACQTPAALAS